MTWYLIEGPDDTGKTTLANSFAKKGYAYEHAGPEDTLPVLAKRMAALQDVRNVVWDRAHLGEIVHGPERGYSASLGWWRLIEAFLLEKYARTYLLRVRQGSPTEWENDHNRQRWLVEKFDNAARESVLHWDESQPLLSTFHSFAPYQFEDRIDPEGLGGLANAQNRPYVWILGEQESSKTPVPWPFATRCGIELIWPAINPRDVRISNCLRRLPNQRLDPTDLHDRWVELGNPPVIALGSSVERWCLTSEIPVATKLPHPQWHLRFHAHESQRYLYFLRMAVANATREALSV